MTVQHTVQALEFGRLNPGRGQAAGHALQTLADHQQIQNLSLIKGHYPGPLIGHPFNKIAPFQSADRLPQRPPADPVTLGERYLAEPLTGL